MKESTLCMICTHQRRQCKANDKMRQDPCASTAGELIKSLQKKKVNSQAATCQDPSSDELSGSERAVQRRSNGEPRGLAGPTRFDRSLSLINVRRPSNTYEEERKKRLRRREGEKCLCTKDGAPRWQMGGDQASERLKIQRVRGRA